jgi:very-short-patch-repair endonuclease
VLARSQLLALGMSRQAIGHRLRRRRLVAVRRGIYAIGSAELTQHGRWMAAVLACGPDAVLSHESAACLWGIRARETRGIEVSLPSNVNPRQPQITIHRRASLTARELTKRERIPVTTVACTLIDLSHRLDQGEQERAISEACVRGLTTPERLLYPLDEGPRRPGAGILRRTLTRHSFALTDSELERIFIQIALRAGLSMPLTRQYVNGFRVDFHWPELNLVVETDGIRYHRDPTQQAKDRVRDHAHTAAGLTQLRFTHHQVAFEPDHVRAVLAAVAERLRPRLVRS